MTDVFLFFKISFKQTHRRLCESAAALWNL